MARNATKQDEQIVAKTKRETLFRLFRYLFGYKKTIVVVLLLMAASTTIVLLNPIILERAIDVHIANKDETGLVKLGLIGIGLNVLLILLIKLRMYLMAKVSNDVLVNIRRELYEHIQTLGFQFFDSRPTGKILARLMGDVNSLKDVLANCVTTFIPEAVTLIAVIVIMIVKNGKLGLASMSAMPLMAIGVWFVQSKSHKRWQVFRKKNSNLNAFLHEDVAGIRVIQSFHAEEETEETFDDLLKQHYDSFDMAVRFADAFGPVVDICWGIAGMMMYWVGVVLIGKGEVQVGALVSFGSYIAMFWQPLMNLSNFYNQLVTNITGAERIFEILDTEAEITDATNAVELPTIKGEVTFSHVSFHYDDDPDVLSDVSFTVKPGETIALVGPTGAGKSTIVNLLSRFYDVQKGEVKIDGYNIKDVSISSLREQMGVMTQENFLFSGTVRDNIRYGKLDATDEEIEAAAKAVNAHEFIMKMEDGYDTKIKERGAGLSIGQRQLLAFARTMVSAPRILILDEATSSIDTHTELLVQQGIETLLAGRTSFVVAHRLSTIQKADRIFVVDKGGIMESGSPAELMAKKGEYYKLYMAQFEN
ncbi:MAG: ABC transporter ATP-binding protein [Lachnospiraceae bacterium]|nr:ABC transporter ATP-binding protein [Lachnospiraceae bacterium]